MLGAFARGTALFFGCFSLLNTAGTLARPGFDATIWWLDLRFMPEPFLPWATGIVGLLLVVWAFLPPGGRWWGRATDLALVACIGVALYDAGSFYTAIKAGAFRPGWSLPLSAVVAVALGFVFLRRRRTHATSVLPVILVAGLWGLVFPVLQMYLFGYSNYTRRADAAVVFGARVYSDGTLSQALHDRTRTGVALYKEGKVRRLVFSGGPGDGRMHEARAMERYAVLNGVPRKQIIRDQGGINTHASVLNTIRWFERERIRRVLAVSHFYHLPRVKLTYARHGLDVYTVPALETYTLNQMPFLILREIAALWFYYLRPIAELGLQSTGR